MKVAQFKMTRVAASTSSAGIVLQSLLNGQMFLPVNFDVKILGINVNIDVGGDPFAIQTFLPCVADWYSRFTLLTFQGKPVTIPRGSKLNADSVFDTTPLSTLNILNSIAYPMMDLRCLDIYAQALQFNSLAYRVQIAGGTFNLSMYVTVYYE